MKRQWIRLWVKVRTDPKVQRLPPPVFKFWINLLCLAGERDDCDVTHVLHAPYLVTSRHHLVNKWSRMLVESGLLDFQDGQQDGQPARYIIHDWEEYQKVSDISTKRVQEFRERSRNVSETLRNVESRAEQKQIREEKSIPPKAEWQLPPAAAPRLTELIPFAAAACSVAAPELRTQAEKALLRRYEDIRNANNPEGLALTILSDFGIYPPPRTKKHPPKNQAGDDYDELVAEIARHKRLGA